jgi:membrane associated rhomboid family serine protease
MRRSRQVLLAFAVLVGLASFFLAPVFFWYNTPNEPLAFYSATAYRSASCAIFGYGGYGVLYFPHGDGYSQDSRGLRLDCKPPAFGGGGLP